MAHQLKYVEYEIGDKWYCCDGAAVGTPANQWWAPARILGLTPAAYIEWLIDKYKPDSIHWVGTTLVYSWDKQASAHKFCLDMNKFSRQSKILF